MTKPFLNTRIGLHVKDESVECNFSDQLKQALYRLDRISLNETRHLAKPIHIIITSGSELITKHMKGSLHYPGNSPNNDKGNAADIRTSHYSDYIRNKIEDVFKSSSEYKDKFDLIFEGDHFHIEYDPKEKK